MQTHYFFTNVCSLCRAKRGILGASDTTCGNGYITQCSLTWTCPNLHARSRAASPLLFTVSELQLLSRSTSACKSTNIKLNCYFYFHWSSLNQLTVESSNTENCFGFALLHSVIGLKNLHHLLNQSLIQNQNQSQLGHTRFPALGGGYVYSLWVLIGSLCCLHLLWLAIVIMLWFWFHDTQLKTTLQCILHVHVSVILIYYEQPQYQQNVTSLLHRIANYYLQITRSCL